LKLSDFTPFLEVPVSLPGNGWEPWLETAPTGLSGQKRVKKRKTE
jgi:hypothetical protein